MPQGPTPRLGVEKQVEIVTALLDNWIRLYPELRESRERKPRHFTSMVVPLVLSEDTKARIAVAYEGEGKWAEVEIRQSQDFGKEYTAIFLYAD